MEQTRKKNGTFCGRYEFGVLQFYSLCVFFFQKVLLKKCNKKNSKTTRRKTHKARDKERDGKKDAEREKKSSSTIRTKTRIALTRQPNIRKIKLFKRRRKKDK